MKMIQLLSFTIILLAVLTTGPVRAATIEEIKTKVSDFKTSGEINSSDFASGLQNILDQAKTAEVSGDDESKAMYLESFQGALSEASGEAIDASASLTLQGMVP